MAQRLIYIPGIDKWVTIKAYINAVRTAKANPDTEFKQGLTCWWPCKGSEIVSQYFEGVQKRISEAIPYTQRGNS